MNFKEGKFLIINTKIIFFSIISIFNNFNEDDQIVNINGWVLKKKTFLSLLCFIMQMKIQIIIQK